MTVLTPSQRCDLSPHKIHHSRVDITKVSHGGADHHDTEVLLSGADDHHSSADDAEDPQGVAEGQGASVRARDQGGAKSLDLDMASSAVTQELDSLDLETASSAITLELDSLESLQQKNSIPGRDKGTLRTRDQIIFHSHHMETEGAGDQIGFHSHHMGTLRTGDNISLHDRSRANRELTG